MVKIYTSPTCAICFALKEFLKANKIEFEEIDLSQNKKAREEIIKKSSKMELPIIEIDDKIVVGFDKEAICKLLNIKEQRTKNNKQ